MDFIHMLVLGFVVTVVILFIQAINSTINKKGMDERFANLSNFSPSQKVTGKDGKSIIAIDEIRKKVCFIKSSMGNVGLDVLSYKDILSVEVIEDNVTIIKADRGSQLGGALIGGAVLGGVGVIVGGLSGKKTSSDNATRIDLRVTVNRTNSPIHDINFMNLECKKNGMLYNAEMKEARHWLGLFEVIIKRANSEEDGKERGDERITHLQPKYSVADELVKLAELQKEGLLSDGEFNEQKAKLLAQ